MFYYLVQDLKALVFSLISLHFKAWLSAVTAVFSSLTLRRLSPFKYVSVTGGAGVYLWKDDYERKIEHERSKTYYRMYSKVTASGDSADVRLKVPQRVHTAVVAKDHVWRRVYREIPASF